MHETRFVKGLLKGPYGSFCVYTENSPIILLHRLKIAPKRTMLPSSALLSTVGIMAAVKHCPSNQTLTLLL